MNGGDCVSRFAALATFDKRAATHHPYAPTTDRL